MENDTCEMLWQTYIGAYENELELRKEAKKLGLFELALVELGEKNNILDQVIAPLNELQKEKLVELGNAIVARNQARLEFMKYCFPKK